MSDVGRNRHFLGVVRAIVRIQFAVLEVYSFWQ